MLRSLTAALSLSLCFTGALAHADSFKTETQNGSKRALRVGPAPYTGKDFSHGEALAISRRGEAAMRRTTNVAVRLDTIRVVDSATMDFGKVRGGFVRSMAAMAKSGKPADRFVSGYARLMRSDDKAALASVRFGAKALKTDAAVQLGAAQALADYASMHVTPEKQGKLYVEAARYYNKAVSLSAKQDRPLVKAGLKGTKEYMSYYPEMQKLIK
ncbi:MAG: hypothetical protein ABI321_10040 [Polyangia bacterium]